MPNRKKHIGDILGIAWRASEPDQAERARKAEGSGHIVADQHNDDRDDGRAA